MSDVEKVSADEIRQLLYHTREAARIVSRWTPSEMDDKAVAVLDLIPGLDPPPAGTQALSIPWDKLPWERLLPLVLPLIQKAIVAALEKFLASLAEKK